MRALVLLPLLLLAGCPLVPGGGRSGPPPLPASTERWTVDGAWLGATVAELTSALGRPADQVRGRSLTWSPKTYVELGADGTVDNVSGGSALLRGATHVLRTGSSDDEVVQALGEGQVSVARSPRGGGVITTGYVETGRTRSYADGANVLEVSVVSGSVTMFWLRRAR